MKKCFVYVGTYTGENSGSEGIYLCRFDSSTGKLTHVATTTGVDDPTFLASSPDGRVLYAVSEVFEVNGAPGGAVMAYRIDPNTGALTYLNSQSTHGACPCHLTIDRTGQYVLVANYMGGNLAVLPVGTDGSVGPATDVVQHEGCSRVDTERQEGPHPHSITVSPDNRFALAADLGNDLVVVYRLDREKGKLQPIEKGRIEVAPGCGPRHLDFHPNGRFVYLVNELGNAIVAYGYDPETGELEPKDSVSILPAEFDGENLAADIHVHPNGKFLYASNRGHDSIAICSIDEGDGRLKLLGYQATMGRHPRNFGVDPTGNYLLVANRNNNEIVTL